MQLKLRIKFNRIHNRFWSMCLLNSQQFQWKLCRLTIFTSRNQSIEISCAFLSKPFLCEWVWWMQAFKAFAVVQYSDWTMQLKAFQHTFLIDWEQLHQTKGNSIHIRSPFAYQFSNIAPPPPPPPLIQSIFLSLFLFLSSSYGAFILVLTKIKHIDWWWPKNGIRSDKAVTKQ